MQNLALIAALALFGAGLYLTGSPVIWFDPLSVGVVLGAPLALACARRGATRTAADLALAWRVGSDPEALVEAPPASHARAAANLRGIGADALSLGVVVAFANVVALLRSLALAEDPTAALFGELGALFLAPVVGLAFKSLLCDVLASRVEIVNSTTYDFTDEECRVNPL